jgi:hypothetical protein
MLDGLRKGIEWLHPEPDNLLELASGLHALHTLDGELAALTYDSLMDNTVSVRSTGTLTRILSFESDVAAFEVEIDERLRTIMGQVVPPAEGSIELQHSEGSATTDLGAVGSFEFVDVPSGPLRLRLIVDGRIISTTGFFTL